MPEYVVIESFALDRSVRSGVRFFSSFEEAVAFASRHGAIEGRHQGRCLAHYHFCGDAHHHSRQSSIFPVQEGQEMQTPAVTPCTPFWDE